jgi:hypothetical protein
MEWKHPHSPTNKELKMHPTTGKLMLTVLWGSQGLRLEHYQERSSTVRSTHNREMLCDKLKPAIQSKQGAVHLSLKTLSVHHGPATEENGTFFACLSAQNVLFFEYKEDCAVMDKVD